MRRTGAMIVVAALLVVTASGCGTWANLDGRAFFCSIAPSNRPPMPMGGAGTDLYMIGLALSEPLGGDGVLVFGTLALIDLPFSLVGDIVTLPWATYEFTRESTNPTGRYDKGFKLNETPSPFTPGLIPDTTRVEPPQASAR